MRLQTVIAATCKARPDAGFGGHWFEATEFHIPLENAAFDAIEDFLRAFRALITA
jgi:hypothetical protein